MQKKLRVLQHGVGAKGKDMVRLMLKKAEIEVVGAVDIVGVGNDLGTVIGLDKKLGIAISDDLDTVLATTKPDVMLDATLAYTKQLYSIFMKALEAKVNIISIGAQAFNPWVNEPELARKLDKAAKRNGVTLVGTGIGTGFVYDVLPLFFTGICGHVRKIVCDRGSDQSKSGPSMRRRCGYGLFKDEAERKLATGEVALSVAYHDQVHFIADCLGWKISDIREETEFLISYTTRDHLPSYVIQPGQVCGHRHNCYGMKDGETAIELKNIQSTDPALDGFETHYTLSIEGEPSFTVDVPGLSLAKNVPMFVSAHAVNWIPYIIKAKPGLLTNARDFPLVACLPSI